MDGGFSLSLLYFGAHSDLCATVFFGVRLKEELLLYWLLVEEQWERIRREPDWKQKFKIFCGLGPDAKRTLPRTAIYLDRAMWFASGILAAKVFLGE